MPFGSLERFYIVAIGGFIVILTVIIVTCFVGPGCWGFECLIRREKKKKLKNQILGPVTATDEKSMHTCESNWNFWLDNHDYVIYQTENCDINEKLSNSEENSVFNPNDKIFNLKCISLLDSQNSYPREQNGNPTLKIRLFYSLLKNNEEMGRLEVQVLSATSLSYREYIAALDPYVSINVLIKKWSFQRSDREICSVQTRVMKNCLNPNFDQSFVFDAMVREIKNWCLKFTIFDNDKLTRTRPLFEKKITVKDVISLSDASAVSLTLDMDKAVPDIGSLHFGIRYLPTAQKLNVNVLKAGKLKYQSHVTSLLEFYPYIRVVLLNSQGKCIKKKKTCFKQGEFNPIFNQSFTFDLTYWKIEEIMLLVMLCTKISNQMIDNDDNSGNSADGDIEKTLKQNKDKVLGTLILGRNVNCTTARNHWTTVMQNPRKMISVWHELR